LAFLHLFIEEVYAGFVRRVIAFVISGPIPLCGMALRYVAADISAAAGTACGEADMKWPVLARCA